MKKNAAAILLLLFISLFAKAQKAMPPVYEIKTDTAYWNEIDSKYWKVLEDKEATLTVESAAQLFAIGKFHFITEGIDTAVNTYWFIYSIKNVMNRESHVSLNSMSEKDDFYVKQPAGKWQHFSSGYKQSWIKKDGLKKADCIPQTLQPGQEIFVFQRTYNKKAGLPQGFQIAIVNTQQAVLNTYVSVLDTNPVLFPVEMMMEVFYGGMLMIVFVFSLLFYRAVRQKVYMYFALYVLLLSITKFTNPFIIFINWYDRDNAYVGYYFGYLTPFVSYFLIQFIRLFFSVKNNFPRWDRFLQLLSFVLIPLLLLRAYFYTHFDVGFVILRKVFVMPGINFFIVFLPLLLSLFMFMSKPDKSNQYKTILAGALPYFLWRVITSGIDMFHFIFFKWNLNDNTGTFNWALYNIIEIITMLWFILSFSIVLFHQFIELKKLNAQQELDKERLAREKEVERNQLIAQQKVQLEKDVALRTMELKKSLEDLQLSQSQLIQSEKMASLGELTAGIAHEIQNPLNFVNNFSEVNRELIDEMQHEMDKGNYTDAKEISNDIKDNEEKINHHGKRADAIVKGMLQHSQSNSGIKEPTDINKLADEYLRLAYHGLRAKDKSFNATLKTDFDETIGNIHIIPQDIGRVILNLINNAFYAIDEKKKQNGEGYEATVSVSTKKVGDKILIRIKDNGNGIPQKIVDKIFQPFFTTKPTGQGTGLGLSLSYDIIKAHGGELKVDTRDGEGAEFIISLPII